MADSNPVEVKKDLERELPIPIAWRPTFVAIAQAFVDGDYQLSRGIPGVEDVDDKTASRISQFVSDYGEVLVPLTDAVWERSIYLWMDDYWQVIVDLCTESEGVSDLILDGKMRGSGGTFSFEVCSVYVP